MHVSRLPLETQRHRALEQRMLIIHIVLVLCGLVILARLMELQLLRGEEYRSYAQAQHYGGVVLPARRGEILSQSSKTTETSILATNTTLDLLYVDPLVTDDPVMVADSLADLLVTPEVHAACSAGSQLCPRELMDEYAAAFDPMVRMNILLSTTLLEPLPVNLPLPSASDLPTLTEVRRRFARSIEERISEKRVTFVPLLYGANKKQMAAVEDLGFAGFTVNHRTRLVSANPEEINQNQLSSIARRLADPLGKDPIVLRDLLRSRPLRYVSIMRRLPPAVSLRVRDLLLKSLQETLQWRKAAPSTEAAEQIKDPLRCVALIPEHWRYYPDGTVASHVVGFLNPNQEAQYGIERTFDPQLRGQEGLISTVSDPSGGQILTADQRIIDPKDGDTIVLTIDRAIQKEVEAIMDKAVENANADSGQVIIMDPKTGRILAMVNAPPFDGNNYGMVYEKEPMILSPAKQKHVVVEIYHPDTRAFVLKAYIDDVFTEEGLRMLSAEKQRKLKEIEELYDLRDIVRYYLYLGETTRIELFPTDRPEVWLKYRNTIGVGAYLNRTVQTVYEPGSVMKPVTMAIAIDQGEVTPTDIYNDTGPVKVDEYTIQNALLKYYGKVTMTNCLEFSINTCMTSVSMKLGRKLFYRALDRFGFGHITGVELEDELPGELKPWKTWSNALLATSAYGQGLSATPLQMVTAFAALANGGKLVKPMVIDRIIHPDGSSDRSQPKILDQVITPESSATITAMLVSSVRNGYAKSAGVPGYRIAGKTGTSQIAGPGGKYETGTGSVITSFAGYAPAGNPRFVILVKFDRPKARGKELGVQSAAPVFHDIAAFLFKYYGIPPDEK